MAKEKYKYNYPQLRIKNVRLFDKFIKLCDDNGLVRMQAIETAIVQFMDNFNNSKQKGKR